MRVMTLICGTLAALMMPGLVSASLFGDPLDVEDDFSALIQSTENNVLPYAEGKYAIQEIRPHSQSDVFRTQIVQFKKLPSPGVYLVLPSTPEMDHIIDGNRTIIGFHVNGLENRTLTMYMMTVPADGNLQQIKTRYYLVDDTKATKNVYQFGNHACAAVFMFLQVRGEKDSPCKSTHTDIHRMPSKDPVANEFAMRLIGDHYRKEGRATVDGASIYQLHYRFVKIPEDFHVDDNNWRPK